MSESIIEIKNCTKYYGATPGVENISLLVEPGEVFGFLGPNGAGKTTTIRLILGLLSGSTGDIKLFGESGRKNKIHLRNRTGYLPGDYRAYDYMKAGPFLKYISCFRKSQPILREHLLNRFGVKDQQLNQRIKDLSHGNRQKIGLIMAMEHDPELLILDEPTIGLDPFMQEAFYESIAEFRERGKTIFLSSHILSEVEKICQRIAIIRAGKIVATETLENLKKKQRRRIVIQFRNRMPEIAPTPEGADFIEQKGRKFIYQLHGEWPVFLQSIAQWPVENIIIPEAELEDIFFAYYQDTNHDQH